MLSHVLYKLYAFDCLAHKSYHERHPDITFDSNENYDTYQGSAPSGPPYYAVHSSTQRNRFRAEKASTAHQSANSQVNGV